LADLHTDGVALVMGALHVAPTRCERRTCEDMDLDVGNGAIQAGNEGSEARNGCFEAGNEPFEA